MQGEEGNREGQCDPPIDEQQFLSGVKVVDIGDVRVSRGLSRRHVSSCKHRRVTYDQRERRVWCRDCETNVDTFDAFLMLVEHFDEANKKAQRLLDEAHEASKFKLISRAAKSIDRSWRSRNMVPSCPHCHAGIWPEDALRMGSVGKEYDKARKLRALQNKPNTPNP